MLISFNLNFLWSLKFVLSVVLMELVSFIFKILQKYTIIFFKIIRRKQTSITNQSFNDKHKISESNAKVSTHCLIVWLYPKYACFYVFKFVNFFRNIFNSKTIKKNNFIIFTILSNQMCTNICKFINIYYICPILYFFR